MKTNFNHLDDKFHFGKFRGCSLGEVLMFSPDYVRWVIEHVSGRICVIYDSTIEEIKTIFPGFLITEDFEYYRKLRLQENQESEDNFEDYDDNDDYFEYVDYREERTYNKYGGSWAQDVEGYSDDEIDTIFDGDPTAYWNID